MPDMLIFAFICGLATLIVYFLHSINALRNELNLRQRVEALEASVLKQVLPAVVALVPPARKPRVRKVKTS